MNNIGKSIEEGLLIDFRRWLGDPHGSYNERWDNERQLCLTIEFLFTPLFKRYPDRRLHEYWCDGIVYFECPGRELPDLRFTGTAMFFCKQKFCGFAPFELDMCYRSLDSKTPESANFRFGEADPSLVVARMPTGPHSEWEQTAVDVHLRRPVRAEDWAVNLALDPYSVG